MSTKEDPASKNVVSLVFRKVVHTNEVNYSYKKVGQPVLQVDFLGDVHTFEDVGEALFKNYLREILDEELYEHMWRFCPCDDDVQDSVKLSIAVPILSKDMQFAPAFQIFVHDPVLPTEYRIKEGTDLIFRYDEGSPTVLAVTVESIKPMPADKKAEDYPLVKAEEADPAAGEKRKRISEAAVLTITMDEAYPLLANRLLKESRVALNIGRGSDEIPNKNVDDSFWGRIWGGGSSETCNAAYDRSVEIPRPFSNIDEAWLCLEKGIDTQMSPGHPCVEKITERKSRTTGQLYREVDKERMKDFTVVLRPYPSSVPRSEYLQEMR